MEHIRFSLDVRRAYDAYLTTLQNIFLSARLAGAAMTPRTVVDAQTQAHAAHATFVAAVDARVTQLLQMVAGGALTDPQVTARGAGFVQAASVQTANDIRTLVRKLRAPDPKALFSGQLDGPMKQLLRKKQSAIEFQARDSAGRVWLSAPLMEFLARDFAYQLTIDMQARTIGQDSDLAQIAYFDPKHENSGLIVSLSGADGYPSLADVRAKIFHPNASAQLTYVRTQ